MRAESIASERLGAWAELLAALAARRRRAGGRAGGGAATTGRSACACRSRSTTPRACASAPRSRSCAASRRRRGRRSPCRSKTAGPCGPTARAAPHRRRTAAAAGPGAASASPAPRRGRCCRPGCRAAPGWSCVLLVLFVAVAAGAYPVVRRLTRRLEALKHGVEHFGAGQLGHRVAVSGQRRGRRAWRPASTSPRRASRRCVQSHQIAARQRQPRAALAAGAHEDGGVDARRCAAGAARAR